MLAAKIPDGEGDMSHGVHAVQHEVEHQIEHEKEGHGGGHGGGDKKGITQNQKIALVIAVIALFLAICETMGKSAQTLGIELNIKASDTWNFFQAKTVRQTSLRVAAEAMTLQVEAAPNEQAKKAMLEQIEKWQATVKRYESDPKEKDGRKELRAMAEQFAHNSELAMARYHNYEFGSAAFQIGIVLASAAVITGAVSLVYLAMGLAAIGLGFMGLGLFAPHVPHDVMHWIEHLFTSSAAHSGEGH
jgi:uncharacterized protein DUF4337